jgi:glycosyltransferase involved in cell wall biosynthesis
MKSTYKILFLANSLSIGGAERQLSILMKYLPHNWESKIWSSDDGLFSKVIQEMGIETTIDKRKFRYDVLPFFRLWNLIRTQRPDIIHSWGWMSTFAAGPICKILNIPLIDCAIQDGLRLSRASSLASRWADLVIANSQAGLRVSGINPKRVRVIYNGLDPEWLKLSEMNGDSPQKRFTVVMVARMVRAKDYTTYFSAARKLLFLNSESMQFWAIGSGKDRSKLISESKDLIDSGSFQFPEAGIDVLKYVKQANVGILLTNPVYHAEGIPNSIMEYMACGLPVICNKSGGNEELVIDGETGFLINPGDADTLAERLNYLYKNPEIARKMGTAGKERLLKEFSVEKMVKGMISVYQEVLTN